MSVVSVCLSLNFMAVCLFALQLQICTCLYQDPSLGNGISSAKIFQVCFPENPKVILNANILRSVL